MTRRRFRSARQTNGLTQNEERVLVALYTAPSPALPAEVERITNVSRRTVRRIELRMPDMMFRHYDNFLSLTESGRRVVEMIAGRADGRVVPVASAEEARRLFP